MRTNGIALLVALTFIFGVLVFAHILGKQAHADGFVPYPSDSLQCTETQTLWCQLEDHYEQVWSTKECLYLRLQAGLYWSIVRVGGHEERFYTPTRQPYRHLWCASICYLMGREPYQWRWPVQCCDRVCPNLDLEAE